MMGAIGARTQWHPGPKRPGRDAVAEASVSLASGRGRATPSPRPRTRTAHRGGGSPPASGVRRPRCLALDLVVATGSRLDGFQRGIHEDHRSQDEGDKGTVVLHGGGENLLVRAFVALLAPGIAYFAAQERWLAERERTSLRETATVAMASLVFGSAAALVFGAIRILAPSYTPDLGRLMREGQTYIKEEYSEILLWGMAFVTVATALAWLVGNGLAKRKVGGVQKTTFESAWSRALREGGTGWVRAGCDLLDGTYLEGWLISLNNDLKETDDRDLVVSGPQLWIRRDGALQSWNAGTVVVSASQLRLLSFSYYDDSKIPVLNGPGDETDRNLPCHGVEPIADNVDGSVGR